MSDFIGIALLVGLLWFATQAFAADELLITAVFVGCAIAALIELLRGRHR